jgi:transposase InsO family protein
MARLGSLSLSDRSQRSALSQAADAKGVPVSYPTHPDRPGFQTDRGGEFFGIRFQIALQDLNIKFRPIRPRSPHLNGKKGKVERSQLTDKMEFWPTVEPTDPAIEQKLLEWQRFYNAVLQCGSTMRFYNEDRPHTRLGWRPPAARFNDLREITPSWETVRQWYDTATEPFRERDSSFDVDLRAIKRSQ